MLEKLAAFGRSVGNLFFEIPPAHSLSNSKGELSLAHATLPRVSGAEFADGKGLHDIILSKDGRTYTYIDRSNGQNVVAAVPASGKFELYGAQYEVSVVEGFVRGYATYRPNSPWALLTTESTSVSSSTHDNNAPVIPVILRRTFEQTGIMKIRVDNDKTEIVVTESDTGRIEIEAQEGVDVKLKDGTLNVESLNGSIAVPRSGNFEIDLDGCRGGISAKVGAPGRVVSTSGHIEIVLTRPLAVTVAANYGEVSVSGMKANGSNSWLPPNGEATGTLEISAYSGNVKVRYALAA